MSGSMTLYLQYLETVAKGENFLSRGLPGNRCQGQGQG